MRAILRLYHNSEITVDEAAMRMTRHALNKGLDSYLTSQLLDMIRMWRKGKLASYVLENIS